MSYEFSAPQCDTITDALLSFMTEEIRQIGAIQRFLYGYNTLGEEEMLGEPLYVYEEANDSAYLRAVDNFQTYISELMLCIFTIYPQPFFGKKFDAEVLFSDSSIEEIRKLVIDRQVSDLAYKSIVDLEKFVSEKFGFLLFASDVQRSRVKYLYDVRNLITHNRGIVNRRFLTSNPRSKNVLNKRMHAPQCLRASIYLKSVAIGIDSRALTKFNFSSNMTVTKSELDNV